MDTGVLNTSDGNAVQTEVLTSGNFARDLSTATGTAAITGIGFQPKGVIFFNLVDSSVSAGVGVDDGTTPHAWGSNISGTPDDYGWNNLRSISYYLSGGNSYFGNVNSFDSDGFTISWTKNGTPTGILRILYMAFK